MRFTITTLRRGALAVAPLAAALIAACAGDPPAGPDALRPESFELSLVGRQTPPFLAYTLQFGGSVWIKSARLKSTVAGRTIDPRIFDDRSGNGGTGGGSRDSTTAAAEMADIREFEEHGGSTITSAISGHHTDTSAVNVERRGDLLILTRTGPVAAQVRVDTAQFVEGKLVTTVHEWERFGTKANNVQFIYSIVK